MTKRIAGLAVFAVGALALSACSPAATDGTDGDTVTLEMQTNFGAPDPSLKVLEEITDWSLRCLQPESPSDP